EVGSNIKDYKKGDRVGVMPVIPCGNCYYCQNGKENVCANRTAIGYEFDGGFAEYIRIPETALQSENMVKLPDNVSFEQAVIAEPLACCINGIKKANVKFNDTVVVVGGGPIGQMHVQLAKIAGAKKVILSELHNHRREIALDIGADIVVNHEEQSLEDTVCKANNEYGEEGCI